MDLKQSEEIKMNEGFVKIAFFAKKNEMNLAKKFELGGIKKRKCSFYSDPDLPKMRPLNLNVRLR